MKILMLFLACFAPVAWAGTPIDLKAVTEAVKKENFQVYSNAQRVYQAKESVQEARKRLLPNLNLWKLLKVAIDPTSIIEVIPDVAPFLVPSNWFRLQQRELLYLAEREGYRALWANELLTARLLYYRLLLDQDLLSILDSYSKDLEELYMIADSRAAIGFEKVETARTLEMRLIAIREDKRNVALLVKLERDQLSFALGKPAEVILDPVAVALPNLEAEKPISYEKFLFRVLEASPENKQYDYFLKVIPWIKRESSFSFLGGSSFSRGVAGGVFDHLPEVDGLGFAEGSIQRIINAESDILKNQQKGIIETLKRQLKHVSENWNMTISAASDYRRKVELASANLNDLKDHMWMGEHIDITELANATHDKNIAESMFLERRYGFLADQERLMRLLFDGEYYMKASSVDEVKK